ncbi:hypothetical protein PGT21_000950 [Puccinia graminis f. sp. tritici]|uniref:Uncharacterized protein n=1 Tax=Puccinia graminis f. sp. tritici TaxID=56615 RepID=A0A5B0LI21_PUCGR|nr:hypothetical protein PGT21_000950 [Puccinia graminis f. sp. tritici]
MGRWAIKSDELKARHQRPVSNVQGSGISDRHELCQLIIRISYLNAWDLAHQHFRLSSTVGQNSHTLNNWTTAPGLGSSTSGSSASGGAGGAKWSAGSLTNWNQQAHSRTAT